MCREMSGMRRQNASLCRVRNVARVSTAQGPAEVVLLSGKNGLTPDQPPRDAVGARNKVQLSRARLRQPTQTGLSAMAARAAP